MTLLVRALTHSHRCGARQAARITGNKFVYLKNQAALLELALTQWAVHRAVAKGYTPIATPDLVHPDIMAGCGYQVPCLFRAFVGVPTYLETDTT